MPLVNAGGLVRHDLSSLKYEPLDLSASRPSIRLAVLQPGPRESSLRVALASAAFADRPKYEALSYTWGRPDEVRAIELNGRRVDVRKNLALALTQLRHTSEARVLWIDAICINQADLIERNRQVELMSYIYSRAQRVLVWLGCIVKVEDGKAMPRTLGGPEPVDTRTLSLQPYWSRIWIVQEIGAAAALELHWGLETLGNKHVAARSSTWEAFFRSMPRGSQNLAMKLAEQREGRHGDSFLLANLMEVCKDSLCEEPRDKVYGFVGIAHDCQDGSFPVDYSKLLFELYEDVVRFQYRAAALNTKTVVHFSQLVQKLFGGPAAMQQDLQRTGKTNALCPLGSNSERWKAFKTLGVYTGSITAIGCSYDDFIAVPDATRKWKVSLQKCQTDLEQLRRKNEGFMRVLLDLDKAELDRIRPIEASFSWKGAKDMHEVLGVTTRVGRSEHELLPLFTFDSETSSSSASTSPSSPRLFSTRSGVIGLVPENARVGDMLFHFWDSDVVAVVRLEGTSYVRIVGRAAVANAEYSASTKFYTPQDVDVAEGTGLDFQGKGVELYTDIKTLQIMTE